MAEQNPRSVLLVVSFNAVPITTGSKPYDARVSLGESPAQITPDGIVAVDVHPPAFGNTELLLYAGADAWEKALAERLGSPVTLDWGCFGETLSLAGASLEDLRVGAVWSIGDGGAAIRVTGFRPPRDLVPAVAAATGIDRKVLLEVATNAPPAVRVQVERAGPIQGRAWLRLVDPGAGTSVGELYLRLRLPAQPDPSCGYAVRST